MSFAARSASCVEIADPVRMDAAIVLAKASVADPTGTVARETGIVRGLLIATDSGRRRRISFRRATASRAAKEPRKKVVRGATVIDVLRVNEVRATGHPVRPVHAMGDHVPKDVHRKASAAREIVARTDRLARDSRATLVRATATADRRKGNGARPATASGSRTTRLRLAVKNASRNRRPSGNRTATSPPIGRTE